MTATLTAPVFHAGDKVSYHGHEATVIHGNEPAPEWGCDEPGTHVNILLDRAVRGLSRQMDVAATALLPADPFAKEA